MSIFAAVLFDVSTCEKSTGQLTQELTLKLLSAERAACVAVMYCSNEGRRQVVHVVSRAPSRHVRVSGIG